MSYILSIYNIPELKIAIQDTECKILLDFTAKTAEDLPDAIYKISQKYPDWVENIQEVFIISHYANIMAHRSIMSMAQALSVMIDVNKIKCINIEKLVLSQLHIQEQEIMHCIYHCYNHKIHTKHQKLEGQINRILYKKIMHDNTKHALLINDDENYHNITSADIEQMLSVDKLKCINKHYYCTIDKIILN